MANKDLTSEWITNVARIKVSESPLCRDLILFRKGSKTGKFRTLHPREERGYLYLCFCVEKKRYKILASRVVYAARYGVCPKDMRVSYKDNDKTNIHPDNLELLTTKELFHKKVWNRRK